MAAIPAYPSLDDILGNRGMVIARSDSGGKMCEELNPVVEKHCTDIQGKAIEQASQYAAILAELRHERGIYDKSIYIVRDIALAMAGDCESIQGIAEHYQKIIKVYDAAIDGMMREFNEVMQLDFPELEGAE